MTEKITDEHDLVMCPLGDDRVCTRGGIDVDDPKCGPTINATYRACAFWHGGMCDISRIAALMSMMPTLAQLIGGHANMSMVDDAAAQISTAFNDGEVWD